ncbi:hypothetical protein Pan44_16440 [Caulifigura coniformis]|uniref:VWFA domain-containing protein n=1 Tax=Caulifigura coniformis TaxID=2527983 RepID=A0A517SBW1_9PLAN|nr:hypothetical protein [Caulifigura coniformis]QDT53621.1 hypothetical protein Pan44_16440 [Caulifigura coniformis]
MAFLIVCVLAACGLIVLLHSYERKLISRKLGVTLLSLRLAAVACLFLVLLEPVMAWMTSAERSGRVVVAVDGSVSMDTIDLQSTKAEKLAWARAIGLIGNSDSDQRLERWIAAYDKGESPEWATSDEEPDAEKRRLLSEARRQNVEGLLKELDGFTRKDLVQRLLGPGREGLLRQLEGNVAVDLVVFGGNTIDADPATLGNTLKQPPRLLKPEETDLVQAITSAAAHSGRGKLEGIVVLTDGRNSTEQRAQQETTSAPAISTPVYPVLIGSGHKPKDLAVAVLDSPPSAFLNDKPVVRATLRTAGFADTDVVVELTRLDKPDMEPQRKTLRPTGPTTDVEFTLDADEVGRRRYKLAAVVQPGETRDDNNERQFSMQIVDDQASILILDGEPRWEFRYLESALHRDERVKVEAVVFRQPYMGLLPEPFFPRALTLPEDVRPAAESPFARFDLVIVGDVPPQQVTDEVWRWLDRYVREEGGTLILAAGQRDFPLKHRSEIVQSLLPVVDLEPYTVDPASGIAAPRDRGFRWHVSPDGEAFDVLRLAQTDEENRDVWENLPGHSWGLVGMAKPGATVWASAMPPRGQPGPNWDREHALFAQQYVGAGQVVWLGVDSTWRWRYGVGDAYHHRFWGQLARWAADFKSAAGNEFVRFGVDRPSINPDEETVVRARWDAKFLRKHPELKARARVMRINGDAEEEAAVIELKPTDGRAIVFEGRVSRLKAGEYRVRLEADGVPLGDIPIQAELLVTERLTPELADVSANREWLAEVARASNGRLFEAGDVRELPKLFDRSTESVSEHQQLTVWNHWGVLAILLALLSTEWILRKLNGLP